MAAGSRGREEPLDGVRRNDREALLAPYREAVAVSGATADEVDASGWAAQEMLAFKEAQGGSLVDWSADDVAAFLEDYYPLQGAVTGDAIDDLPARFDAFLAWLAQSGRGVQERLSVARARLAERRGAFLEAARDETRYGPAKLVTARMKAEGLEVSDKAAMAGFIQRFNEELARNPALLPMIGRPRAKRWAWNGEGEPPSPTAPCPCGSGRRYRKCCMPR